MSAAAPDMPAEVPPAGRRNWAAKRWSWRGCFWLGLVVLLLAGAVAAYVFRPIAIAAPAPLDTHGGSVAEGRYLAQVGNCAACHTAPGGAANAGGVKFATPFGTLYSTNITPDRTVGIGAWTYAQFHAAMKRGLRPDGSHLYPAFPYTSFAKMSDRDLASLYLYLRSIPPVAQANRGNVMDFPFGNRALLHFWKRLFHDDAAFQPETGRSPAWNRGAYLVEAVAHCGACHTPRNMLGAPDEGRALQGGTYTDLVKSGAYRKWAAVDLTPGPHGLRDWSADDLRQYLLTGKNRRAVVHGPMTEVFASTARLAPADATAIATYLRGIEPAPGRWNFAALRSGVNQGEVVYTVHCGTCHLPDGKGDRILGVPLVHNTIVQARDPSSLINVILYGPDLPDPPFSANRTTMKPFGKRLSDEDVAALATYLRSSFGNNAPQVSREQVRRQR
ncbi:mono/diheme cytochrome c family protein [Novosphingobium chloroacetimidivorans]|uniref:Mono/diheme cytochrome c family protein n=1 Tax=Novosphingobium chloroacetimidivorans TaxID=1428314 RepID=A0A7W7NXA0_9SPHN|nr:cytochrome c [Novosphingobium chloroacetimidivorans]MBB4859219.1 mono/diheme cytochrome c family protein [Novosphingobium chloroacetimidivorans]